MNVEEALVTLDTVLNSEHLSNTQELVLRQIWAGRTYAEIAEGSGYDTDYIKKVGSQIWQLLSKEFEEKVTKSNFKSILRRKAQQLQLVASEGITDNSYQDWGEAIDVSSFYGRSEELSTLQQWISNDHCRFVALLGMGGIGKTALAVKLAEQLQNQFKYLIWRSLRNAPLVEDILMQFIQFLSNRQEVYFPGNLDATIARLMHYLRASRCLLVLDNVEPILQSGDYTGRYREGYEGYGQLLRCVGESKHLSCLILTGREQPRGLAAKEGQALLLRSLQLKGLKAEEVRDLLSAKASFSGAEDEWRAITQHYAGNPLALKMVAPTIQTLFEGSLSKFVRFLSQGTFVFEDIRALLEQQFNRLSDLEKQIMYWLAINRELSLQELQDDLISKVSTCKLIENLASLERRVLIEKTIPTIKKNSTSFTQQHIVMEYVTERLVEHVCEKLNTEETELLLSRVLTTGAREDITENQTSGIIQQIMNKLSTTFIIRKDVEYKLNQILLELRHTKVSNRVWDVTPGQHLQSFSKQEGDRTLEHAKFEKKGSSARLVVQSSQISELHQKS